MRLVMMLAAAILMLGWTHAARGEDLAAGVAVEDITPPVGYRMAGYFSERGSTGVTDPLHAKAIVLRQGERRAAMVFCDLLGISLEVSTRARKEASAKTGIPAANIVIAATHSHTGPLYSGALRQYLHDRAVAANGTDAFEKVDYARDVAGRIVRAIVRADAEAAPARLSAGSTLQENLAFNRRFHMKDGTVRFNPGVMNPEIVRPAGPVDPQVGLVAIGRPGRDAPVAALVNFALHLDTTGGTLYSADYPYHLEQALRESLGKEFVLLFGTGTCGDINHIDVSRRERISSQQIGAKLGATVAEALPKLRAIDAPSLAMRNVAVRVPLQKYDEQSTARARQDMAHVGTGARTFLEQVEAYKIMSLRLRGGETIDLEVQVLRLSRDVAVVALPGEVFVELGLAIKRASPFATTLVIELCNDNPAYIPTRKGFAEGSYEIVNSRIAPGGGEAMAEAAIRLLRELVEW